MRYDDDNEDLKGDLTGLRIRDAEKKKSVCHVTWTLLIFRSSQVTELLSESQVAPK